MWFFCIHLYPPPNFKFLAQPAVPAEPYYEPHLQNDHLQFV